MDYRCSRCGATHDIWSSSCHVCGGFGSVDAPRPRAPQAPARRPSTLADAKVVPIERIPTGIPEVDRIFGTSWRNNESGIPTPSISLFAGGEGTGKTTLWLQIATRCRYATQVLTTEQTVDALRETAERIGMSPRDMSRVHVKAVTTLGEAIDAMREHRTRVTIVDSISELVDPTNDKGDTYTNTVRMTTALKREAEERRRAIVCMVQLNNEDAIAGLRKLRHIVDAVMHFEAYGEELRLLHCPRKNRYGRIGVKSWFRMGDRGLEPCDAPEEDPADK